ncbi:hypothetical protein LRS03_13555 [Rhizobacter sp. J219]|uniref:hypothetical protein n=1 Tax=Rhizobacter sp. J219 TaxID=2898430 RepID=UPI0021515351|nr:hypothetical protein [Rhizobacter sp. J219]MCR5883826.1 hypothetical protein [Rhizobacter sp. J219]
MLDENPRHDAPEADRHLVIAALTPRLPLGKHAQRLRMLSEGDALVYSVKSGENSVSKALGWAELKER